MRRMSCIIFAITFIFCQFSVDYPAEADTGSAISISLSEDRLFFPGDTFELAIRIENNPGFVTMPLKITIPEGLSATHMALGYASLMQSFTGPSGWEGFFGGEPGDLVIAPPIAGPTNTYAVWARTSDFVIKDTDLLVYTFKVSDGASPGSQQIKVEFATALGDSYPQNLEGTILDIKEPDPVIVEIVDETYTISASPPSITFDSQETPYSQPEAQTITITNTGTRPITLTEPTSSKYYTGALSKVYLPTTYDTATFTVRPKEGLGEGIHDETIVINGSDGAICTINVSFTVTAPLLPQISEVIPDIANKRITVTTKGPHNNGSSLIVAIYNQEGKVLSTKSEIVNDDSIVITGIDIPYDMGTRVRAMMWTDLITMQPICQSKTMKWGGYMWLLEE